MVSNTSGDSVTADVFMAFQVELVATVRAFLTVGFG